MSFKINFKNEFISGWGLINRVSSRIFKAQSIEEINQVIKKNFGNSLIPRGKGRSYGDSAQNKNQIVVNLEGFNKFHLDKDKGILIAESGATLKEILDYIIPLGFFLPVTPGTKNITIGGAIASDVHGKNHYSKGSIGNHIIKIELLTSSGETLVLEPKKSNELENDRFFWATVGGMGLTGIILKAEILLVPISTNLLKVKTRSFFNIKSLIDEFEQNIHKYEYNVAWIDMFDRNLKGILESSRHLGLEEFNKHLTKKSFNSTKEIEIPFPGVVSFFMNKFTIAIFNKIYFYAKSLNLFKITHLKDFFYPLDKIKNWNKFYGHKGFYQYQFVVPYSPCSIKNLIDIIDIFRDHKIYSYLVVLKRFGQSNKSYLSFPIEGWSLTLDIPNNSKNLQKVFDQTDRIIKKVGGRIYLAKDIRMNSQNFFETYKSLDKWLEIKQKLDPLNLFVSDQSKRLFN